MYEKKYLQWNMCEIKRTDGTIDKEFTFKELINAFDQSEQVYNWIEVFFGLIQANCFLLLIELLFIFAHSTEALSKKRFNIFILVRRLLTVIFYVLGLWALIKVFTWDNHGTLEALSESQGKDGNKPNVCHNDPVLDAEFDDMVAYVHHIQGTFAKIMIFFFFFIVLVSFVFTTYWKFMKCDKYWEDPPKIEEEDSEEDKKSV
jgi:amino acid transporter